MNPLFRIHQRPTNTHTTNTHTTIKHSHTNTPHYSHYITLLKCSSPSCYLSLLLCAKLIYKLLTSDTCDSILPLFLGDTSNIKLTLGNVVVFLLVWNKKPRSPCSDNYLLQWRLITGEGALIIQNSITTFSGLQGMGEIMININRFV